MTTTRWETIIGLEVHAQLKTRTKLFSACPVSGGSTADLEPNSFVDPLTLALPGTLPVPNREAIRLAIRLGLALGSTIDRQSRFARKHYFYPDLPKGYQISQYEAPICQGGGLEIDGRFVRLRRIHLEEDAGKTTHDSKRGQSFVDYNRAGVPLVEIVSEPDLRSAEEAITYLKALHQIVTWLDVSDGDMEAGNFRCDVNVSLRPVGSDKFGTRTEIKNVNSFKFVGLAIESEAARQARILEAGGEVVQETRGYDEATGTTKSQRGKEDAHDYRYFPDPDLMVIQIAAREVDEIARQLPELPAARARRFEVELGLGPAAAAVLTATRARADYFEAAATGSREPKVVGNWIANDLLGTLSALGKDLGDCPVPASEMRALGDHVAMGTLSSKMGKELLQALVGEGATVAGWIAVHGGQVSDVGAIEAAVAEVIAAAPDQVAQYLAGKDKVLSFFVGQVMKKMRGKGNPELIQATVRTALHARKS